MKKYNENDLKILKPEEVVKKTPERYFGTKDINGNVLINSLIEQMVLESNEKVVFFNEDNWSFFGSAYDWVKSGLTNNSVHHLFHNGLGISSSRNNSFRSELFVTIYSENVILLRNNEIVLIKGSSVNEEVSDLLKSKYKNMTAIAFEMSTNQGHTSLKS